MTARRSIPFGALALGCAIALASCGGSSSPGASASNAALVTPGVKTADGGGQAVATVEGTPISKATYEHWLTIERRSGAEHAPQRTLGFLISSSWVLGGARERHLSVSASEVKKRASSLEHGVFPTKKTLAAYLETTGESAEDMQARVRVEILEARIAEAATKGISTQAGREAAIEALQRHFDARWRALTSCAPGYVMEDCKQWKGKTSL